MDTQEGGRARRRRNYRAGRARRADWRAGRGWLQGDRPDGQRGRDCVRRDRSRRPTPDRLDRRAGARLLPPGAARDGAVFGFAVGPHSWKKFLHVPTLRLWRAQRDSDGSISATAESDAPPRLAFIGVRSCELHAIAIQDKVLIGGLTRTPITSCGAPGRSSWQSTVSRPGAPAFAFR